MQDGETETHREKNNSPKSESYLWQSWDFSLEIQRIEPGSMWPSPRSEFPLVLAVFFWAHDFASLRCTVVSKMRMLAPVGLL